MSDRLAVWRRYTGNPDAKTILLAHSMGGLVARYYLEALEGHRDARALITFGTPYRGAPQALEPLVNGMRKGWLDLTSMIRSFTSVYQLLPIYQCIDTGTHWRRVTELGGPQKMDMSLPRVAHGALAPEQLEALPEFFPGLVSARPWTHY